MKDLLVTTPGPRAAVSIRELPGGGVCLYGAVEREVGAASQAARQCLCLLTKCAVQAAARCTGNWQMSGLHSRAFWVHGSKCGSISAWEWVFVFVFVSGM